MGGNLELCSSHKRRRLPCRVHTSPFGAPGLHPCWSGADNGSLMVPVIWMCLNSEEPGAWMLREGKRHWQACSAWFPCISNTASSVGTPLAPVLRKLGKKKLGLKKKKKKEKRTFLRSIWHNYKWHTKLARSFTIIF